MLESVPEEGMTRRDFFNWASRWGASVLVGGALFDNQWVKLFREPDALEARAADRWVYSTCCFCAVGCAVWLGVRDGQVVAVKGVADYPVNKGYLCVKGIYQYKVIHTGNRATRPLVRGPAGFSPVSWDAAIELVAGRFMEVVNAHGPHALAIYHCSQLLLEEYYAIAKLARGGIGTKNLDANSRLCLSSVAQGYLRSFGADGPPGNYDDIEHADCILMIGTNTAEQHPILFYRLRRAKQDRNPAVILVDPRRTPTAEIADYHLAIRGGTDAAFLNAIIHVLINENLVDYDFVKAHTTGFDSLARSVKDFPPEMAADITGIPAETIRGAALVYGRAKAALTLWMVGVNQSTSGTRQVNLINNLSLLTGNIGRRGTGPFSISGQCSSMSVREAGSSTALPGGRHFDSKKDREELAALWNVPVERIPDREGPVTTDLWEEMADGRIKALWIIASNPVVSMPDAGRFRELMSKLDLLVVQDCYADTETASMAHVILPGAMWSEKTGTFTNSERRVNMVKKAVEPPGEALPDWEIVTLIGRKMGYGALMNFRSSEEIFEEWRRVSQGTVVDMSGMTHERIERLRGIRWPCPSPESEGTARLYTDLRFNTPHGKARLIPGVYKGPAEDVDEEYPLHLLTGRVLQLWQTNTKTRNVDELMSEVPAPFVEIAPQDARRLGVVDWEEVKVVSRRGSIRVRAWVTDRVPPGHVFVPFHFGQAPANWLTIRRLDPYSHQPALKSAAVRVEKPSGREQP